MKSSTYWDKRAINRLNENEKASEKYIKRIQKVYDRANKNIQSELESIYRNYSNETGIDIQTLKTLLSKKATQRTFDELKKQGLGDYVRENYKSRISRLEQIQAQIYAKAKEVYTEEELEQTMCYSGVINEDYYRTIYDVQQGTGYNFSFNKIDDNMMNSVLSERWSGKNYSQRIWTNTNILADSVAEIIGGALLSGQGIEKTARQIRDRFNVGKYYSTRLVRTETNYFHNLADSMAYEEMGVKKYVFVATLDNRTSEMCQENDGKVYNYSDMEIGVNFPPLHPNCRSTTRGYLGKEAEKNLKRRARNPITGQLETVDNVSYKNWIARYNIVDNKNGMFVTDKNVIYNTKSLNKLNNSLVESNAKQLDKLLGKYPKMAKYIKDRGLTFGGSNSTNAIAYTRYTNDLKNIGIYLENRYYKDNKKYTNTIVGAIKKGKFMPCSKKSIDVYAVNHEFGHVVETHLLNNYNKSHPTEYQNALVNRYRWTNYKEKVYNDIRKDIIDIAMKNNKSFDITKQLSEYGMSSPAEFFAECFANMESGRPNQLGKAIKEYLKGVI